MCVAIPIICFIGDVSYRYLMRLELYKIIHEGKHELYGFDKEIVEFIVNN